MSWDGYITNMKEQSKDVNGVEHISKGGIYGMGGEEWASSPDFKVSQAEVLTLVNCFTSGEFSVVQANGIHLGGTKYQFIRLDDGKLMVGKKKGEGSISIRKTNKAIIIAFCPEGKQAGNANKGIHMIGDYLETQSL